MYEDIKELEAKYEIKDFPLNVLIETGNYCNLNCITCTNDKITRKRGYINTLLYRKIIDEIATENPYTRVWLDFYGEPLLSRFKLYFMIDYAKKKGLKNVCVNTNGTLIDEEMAEMLLDSNIDFISIDCDGFSKEVYEKIRVGADRDVVYKNIEHLLKRKQERGDDIKIEIKAMEMAENQDEIDTIMTYWREKGAWTTKRRLITWGGSCEDISIDVKEDRIACGYAVGTCPITWQGDVVNCAVDVDASMIWGNINNSSIKEIWSKRNEAMVKFHMDHQFDKLPAICHLCKDWAIVGEERFDEFGNPIHKSYEHEEIMLEN